MLSGSRNTRDEGDDLASLIESSFELQDGDVLCIASTVVAKSEVRFRRFEYC